MTSVDVSQVAAEKQCFSITGKPEVFHKSLSRCEVHRISSGKGHGKHMVPVLVFGREQDAVVSGQFKVSNGIKEGLILRKPPDLLRSALCGIG